MRAAFLITQIGPYGAARAAAASRAGRERGDTAAVLELASTSTTYQGWSRPDLSGLDVLTLFPGRDADRIAPPAIALATWRGLDRLRPDVVFTNGWSDAYALAALAWCGAHGRPAVAMSETHRADGERRWSRELVKGVIVRRFAAALAGGERHVDYLVGLGVPRGRCFTPYDVVDNAHFAAGAARARAAGAQPPYVLSVGRFVEKKNLPRLVRAYAAYATGTPEPWPLVLAGSGPLEAALRAEVSRLGLDALVRFPGWVSYEELPALYAHAGVFVLPSAREQWGLVVNEALASGVPALVSAAAGGAELVRPGVNGFVFDPHDERGLAESLARVAGGSVDRAALGRAAAQGIATHAPERFAGAFWAAAGAAVAAR